jgi:hypothetical protein
VVSLTFPANAAFEYPLYGVKTFGMAGAVNLLQPTSLDFCEHPALAGDGVQLEMALSQLYNMPDFTLGSLAALGEMGPLGVAVAGNQLTGSDFYWERDYRLGLSMHVFSLCRIGLAGDYQLIQFSGGYEDIDLFSFSVGALLQISDDLSLAATLANANRPSYGDEQDHLARRGLISVSYGFSERLVLSAGIRFEEHIPDRLSIGQELDLFDELTVRVGLRNQPLDFSGGISLHLSRFSFDYGFSNNVYLGGTHRIGLRMEIGD